MEEDGEEDLYAAAGFRSNKNPNTLENEKCQRSFSADATEYWINPWKSALSAVFSNMLASGMAGSSLQSAGLESDPPLSWKFVCWS